jgi:hypothetical protein
MGLATACDAWRSDGKPGKGRHGGGLGRRFAGGAGGLQASGRGAKFPTNLSVTRVGEADYESGGQEFESLRARHLVPNIANAAIEISA